MPLITETGVGAELGLQRAHVAGLDDVRRVLGRVDRDLHRVRLIVDADPGRDPLPRLDRDRERGLVRALVLERHHLQIELVATLRGHRQTDPAAGLTGHEVDRVGRDELSRQHQVPLVLTVLVINHDNHLARRDVLLIHDGGLPSAPPDRPREGRRLFLPRPQKILVCSSTVLHSARVR